jgi:hypothetical protein
MSRRRQIDTDALMQEFSPVAAFAQSGRGEPKTKTTKEPDAGKPENLQTGKTASGQVGKQGSPQAGQPIQKYSGYLTPESIKRLKLLAVEEGRKDYELLEEAVQLLFKSRGQK